MKESKVINGRAITLEILDGSNKNKMIKINSESINHIQQNGHCVL